MSELFNAISANIASHWVVYSGGGVILGSAIISCMPQKVPRTLDEWWSWFRSSLQTALPARHNPNPPEPVQIPSSAPLTKET